MNSESKFSVSDVAAQLSAQEGLSLEESQARVWAARDAQRRGLVATSPARRDDGVARISMADAAMALSKQAGISLEDAQVRIFAARDIMLREAKNEPTRLAHAPSAEQQDRIGKLVAAGVRGGLAPDAALAAARSTVLSG